ncbi:unnamed protein product [Brassica rapa subsp. trilocularis]
MSRKEILLANFWKDIQNLTFPSRPFTLETVASRHGEFSKPLENWDGMH